MSRNIFKTDVQQGLGRRSPRFLNSKERKDENALTNKKIETLRRIQSLLAKNKKAKDFKDDKKRKSLVKMIRSCSDLNSGSNQYQGCDPNIDFGMKGSCPPGDYTNKIYPYGKVYMKKGQDILQCIPKELIGTGTVQQQTQQAELLRLLKTIASHSEDISRMAAYKLGECDSATREEHCEAIVDEKKRPKCTFDSGVCKDKYRTQVSKFDKIQEEINDLKSSISEIDRTLRGTYARNLLMKTTILSDEEEDERKQFQAMKRKRKAMIAHISDLRKKSKKLQEDISVTQLEYARALDEDKMCQMSVKDEGSTLGDCVEDNRCQVIDSETGNKPKKIDRTEKFRRLGTPESAFSGAHECRSIYAENKIYKAENTGVRNLLKRNINSSQLMNTAAKLSDTAKFNKKLSWVTDSGQSGDSVKSNFMRLLNEIEQTYMEYVNLLQPYVPKRKRTLDMDEDDLLKDDPSTQKQIRDKKAAIRLKKCQDIAQVMQKILEKAPLYLQSQLMKLVERVQKDITKTVSKNYYTRKPEDVDPQTTFAKLCATITMVTNKDEMLTKLKSNAIMETYLTSDVAGFEEKEIVIADVGDLSDNWFIMGGAGGKMAGEMVAVVSEIKDNEVTEVEVYVPSTQSWRKYTSASNKPDTTHVPNLHTRIRRRPTKVETITIRPWMESDQSVAAADLGVASAVEFFNKYKYLPKRDYVDQLPIGANNLKKVTEVDKTWLKGMELMKNVKDSDKLESAIMAIEQSLSAKDLKSAITAVEGPETKVEDANPDAGKGKEEQVQDAGKGKEEQVEEAVEEQQGDKVENVENVEGGGNSSGLGVQELSEIEDLLTTLGEDASFATQTQHDDDITMSILPDIEGGGGNRSFLSNIDKETIESLEGGSEDEEDFDLDKFYKTYYENQ